MLQSIQLPKIHLKKPREKAITKQLNLNICVSAVHCYHHLSHPQSVLKSSFALLTLFYKLKEINYFHILQTLHRALLPCLPARVQFAPFVCVANEPCPIGARRPPRASRATQQRGEPCRGVIKSLLLRQADAE